MLERKTCQKLWQIAANSRQMPDLKIFLKILFIYLFLKKHLLTEEEIVKEELKKTSRTSQK